MKLHSYDFLNKFADVEPFCGTMDKRKYELEIF